MAERLILYLDRGTLERFQTGQHNFLRRLSDAVTTQGWRVTARESTAEERAKAPTRDGYALYHMEQPTHARALTCRRSYIGAFWHIEKTAERWNWPVVKAEFPAGDVRRDLADPFLARLAREAFPGPTDAVSDGSIFVPLQGRLLDHRSFQSTSPLAMLETLLERTKAPICATLHPQESYSETEMNALQTLTGRNHRLTVRTGGSIDLLHRCALVATQNSSLAFQGYLLRKPALLFAGIDFHHIAASVDRDGTDAAFAALCDPPPDFAGYIHWFLQEQAINAGRPDCEMRILATLRGHDWPI
ncbi:MAG: hypothetical protein ACRCSU_15965 [Paracoccaceae bacterium]